MENKSRCFLVQQPVTIFSCQEIPVIPLREYLERIYFYTHCSYASMILSMIYVDRFLHSTGMSITSLNVHKLLLTAIMLASKFNDDAYCSNSFFAEVGCVTLDELNQMEQTFLRCICFSLFVSESLFILYSSSLHQRVCTASCSLCSVSVLSPI
ncbi:uncharacterized protein [Blastocystis hominis]|uniref:Cyclin n=1 Tax=Blastocystis hominis TaxID=12968 RepID=D8M9H5_BLAHO|nr:uncharacterized protein [Blastocystis hominis]CBK24714.2 unnamed protein product [Blastocystis hominis]|eukprot:XP_012898762.1 uncharacterized protein [Blastocystis hominis]